MQNRSKEKSVVKAKIGHIDRYNDNAFREDFSKANYLIYGSRPSKTMKVFHSYAIQTTLVLNRQTPAQTADFVNHWAK